MCYATKRKIADCVKVLMRRKEISKITIQDIMDATRMSRQSFYYHFKDIYDVLEWIGLNDFKEQLVGENYNSIEIWVCDLMKTIRKEHQFYEKLANEVEWPRIVQCVKRAIALQLQRILLCENKELFTNHPEEHASCAEFLSTALCYYMIDYVYHHRSVTEERMERDVRFMVRMIREQQRDAPLPFLKVAAM